MNDVLTPEDYELLLSLGGQNAQDADAIKLILSQAEALRAAGQTPQMRSAGRAQMAAHPLEFLGALANQNVARQRENKAGSMQKAMGERTNRQNQMVLASLLRQRQQPQPQPQPQPNPFQAPSGAQVQGIGPQM